MRPVDVNAINCIDSCVTIQDYINTYEPQYAGEVEIQTAELMPWIEDKERQLNIFPVVNDAGQRVYQKALVAWAFSR